MKTKYKIGITIILILGTIIICFLDQFDRNQFYSMQLPAEESQIFFIPNNPKKQELIYSQYFGDEKYNFPRKDFAEVKLYKNNFLISRLSSTTVSDKDERELVAFLNNPSNFDFGETTWDTSEAEYILRFFDDQKVEIGKVWLCLEGCGMTLSIPFSPNMKYGGLSKVGRENIDTIIKNILSK